MTVLIAVVSIYFVIWWVVLFAVLPWGIKSHHEAGIEVPGGGEPASPVNPNLKRKFITTTWISAICLVVGFLVYYFGHIPMPQLPSAPSRFY